MLCLRTGLSSRSPRNQAWRGRSTPAAVMPDHRLANLSRHSRFLPVRTRCSAVCSAMLRSCSTPPHRDHQPPKQSAYQQEGSTSYRDKHGPQVHDRKVIPASERPHNAHACAQHGEFLHRGRCQSQGNAVSLHVPAQYDAGVHAVDETGESGHTVPEVGQVGDVDLAGDHGVARQHGPSSMIEEGNAVVVVTGDGKDLDEPLPASVDTSKPAICRHRKPGHFGVPRRS